MDSWRNTHGEKWARIEDRLHQKKNYNVLLDEDDCTLFWGLGVEEHTRPTEFPCEKTIALCFGGGGAYKTYRVSLRKNTPELIKKLLILTLAR